MLKENTFIKVKFRKMYICAILGWVVEMLGGMADSIIAGAYLDANAVAGIELVSPIDNIVFFVAMLFGAGAAIEHSKMQGAFRYEKADKLAGMAAILAVALSVLIGAALFFGRNLILDFYGVGGSIGEASYEYYLPNIWNSMLYPVLWTIYYFVDYDGDERNILLCDIAMAVMNVLFSLLLVEPLGVAGLGWGTTISSVIGCGLLSMHFFKKSNSIRFKLAFMGKELWNMLKTGSVFSLVTFYIGVIDIIFNKFIIVRFSEDYLTAYTVINIVMNFACILSCAISAGGIFVTVAFGENNIHAIKRSMRITNLYTVIGSIIFTVVMFFLAPIWPETYAITDPAVYDAALFAGKIIPLFFLFAGVVCTYMCYFPYVDKTVEGNILILAYMLVGPLVVAIPMALAGGFNAMSWGFALTPLFALLVTFLYILLTGQVRRLPYLVEPAKDKEVHFDIALNEDSIVEGRERIAAFLRDENVESRIVNNCQLVFEEAMNLIQKKNAKKVICECSVLVDGENVRLITKDNGRIFDLVSEADNSTTFQGYVLARMQTTAKEASHSVTTSFNRNVCVWERSK